MEGKKSEPRRLRARERERPGNGCAVADRVAWCVHLMSTGDWHGYVTRVELAEAWGCSEKRVQEHAAEASRRLRLEGDELAQARLAHAGYLRRIRDDALKTRNMVTGVPDYGSAIRATELAAKFEGHDLAQHVELTGKDGGPVAMTGGPVIMIPPEREEAPADECPDAAEAPGASSAP